MVRQSCGFIVFRRNQGDIEYLLLQSSGRRHHWSPPKDGAWKERNHARSGMVAHASGVPNNGIVRLPGGVMRRETEIATALRETEEETGLLAADLKIYEDSKQKINYRWKGTLKYVTYWLAELINYDKPVTLSNEHQAFKWLQLEEACTTCLRAFQELLRSYNDNILKNLS
ncbi:bis(5'-nucleosyl)-tetraphosphatase [asymmetrical] isoform X1 [Megalopta genalis]|uniref:bis(5'-nucleosyl)-tetraphosphatase [asymmetrical] isoform X1 n=1 Tax=Megalopta genalis TaxID=115081 RepID=UPI003FD2E72B